ncbi:hypothetical protein ACTHRK_18090 [Dietzia cercidiphylli]|uniref:hypothetical protein n=1 Tax=Dietzia cercidiphylli TaxID=498199 RepID=UPI003F80B561
MTAKPGTLLDSFVLTIDGRDVDAQIRLVHAEDGTEMLHHYEGNLLRLTHPARRCTDCTSILIAGSAGGRCYACADGLHMESHTNATYTRDQVGTAANRAADLIQERLDEDGDSLAWSLVNVMVSATDHLLQHPEATLADIFIENFGADAADPAAVMAEYGMD